MPLEMISLEHKTEVLCNEYPISSIPNYIKYAQAKKNFILKFLFSALV